MHSSYILYYITWESMGIKSMTLVRPQLSYKNIYSDVRNMKVNHFILLQHQVQLDNMKIGQKH